MPEVPVMTYIPHPPASLALSDVLDAQQEMYHGVLSTDHPLSRHGLPVLVIDGTPYSAAEWPHPVLPTLIDAFEHDPDGIALAAAAERAGYNIHGDRVRHASAVVAGVTAGTGDSDARLSEHGAAEFNRLLAEAMGSAYPAQQWVVVPGGEGDAEWNRLVRGNGYGEPTEEQRAYAEMVSEGLWGTEDESWWQAAEATVEAAIDAAWAARMDAGAAAWATYQATVGAALADYRAAMAAAEAAYAKAAAEARA